MSSVGAGSEGVRSAYVAVRELDGPRPILLSGSGDWEYGPATGVLCHGVGQVIGQDIHALYFDPATAEIVLRRGDHVCPADSTAVSVVNLSARMRSALDAIEEEADDFYAYVNGVLKAVPGFPNETWRAGFSPAPTADGT